MAPRAALPPCHGCGWPASEREEGRVSVQERCAQRVLGLAAARQALMGCENCDWGCAQQFDPDGRYCGRNPQFCQQCYDRQMARYVELRGFLVDAPLSATLREQVTAMFARHDSTSATNKDEPK